MSTETSKQDLQRAEDEEVLRADPDVLPAGPATFTAEALPQSSIDNIVNKEYGYARLGVAVGSLFMAAGIILVFGGVGGQTKWIAHAFGFNSELTDAPPGLAFAIAGLFVILFTRPKIDGKLNAGAAQPGKRARK